MPEVIYMGPSDTLLVHGHEYHPGDRIRLGADTIGNLTRVGERFGYAHEDHDQAAMVAELHPSDEPTTAVLENADAAPDPKPEPAPKVEPVRATRSGKETD